jgi:hypothetical protein
MVEGYDKDFDKNIMKEKLIDAEETIKAVEATGIEFKNRDEDRLKIAITFYIETMKRITRKRSY